MGGLNLHRLQIFRTVFETMSVSGAARSMGLSQPTVSRHLSIFEDEVDIRLFNNVSGRLEPTWEAQRLYAESGGLFDRLGQIEASMESIRSGQQDTFRIMATPTLGLSALPGAVGKLYRRMPELEIVVDGGRQRNQLMGLRDGSVDVAVGGTMPNRPDLRQHIVARLPLVAVVPPGHPRADEPAFDLAWLAEGCVLHNPHAPIGQILDGALKRCGVTPSRAIRALNIIFAVGLARATGFCTVVDILTARQSALEMRILPLEVPLALDLAVIELASVAERRSVEVFREELAAEVRAILPK